MMKRLGDLPPDTLFMYEKCLCRVMKKDSYTDDYYKRNEMSPFYCVMECDENHQWAGTGDNDSDSLPDNTLVETVTITIQSRP